ncbi:MAG: lipid biosynthesis acyltransferase [Chitinophagaceae bacterium]|nr:lipid biosynthesis acyltransferase [Chitinophagaceae bacterium]
MYYVVYGFLYLLSFLPFRALHILSDFFYLIMYYIVGYRRDVVMNNLKIAFPDKTNRERKKIAKEFYKNFIDSFIEMIKLLSISKEEFDKRMTGNFEVVNDLYASGQSVQIHTGHFFNWEFMNLGSGRNVKGYKFIGVYMPLKNKTFNRLIVKLRSRFGSVLVPATAFRSAFLTIRKEPYVLGLVGDQNAGDPTQAYWHPFFTKMAPFVKGPEKGARNNNIAVVMLNFYKVKRGYYNASFELLTTTPKEMPEGEITKRLIRYIENSIKEHPANYLWTHRRWKWEFDPEKHKHLVI